MSKNFWVIIISFWIACIIAGSGTFFYISYSEKLERKRFVAEFNYDDITVIQEKNSTSPLVTYEANVFINEIRQVIDKMDIYETNISTMLDTNDNNLDYLLEAYQQSKFTKEQFSNIEILNSSLLQKKQYEKIADATYNYLHASSIFYIISAKKLKQSTPFLQQQYKTAQETLSSKKSQLLANYKLHFEPE